MAYIKIDKLYHVIAGVLISLVTYLIGVVVGYPLEFLRLALLTPIVIGIAKEIYDVKVKKSYFDLYDLMFTVTAGWLTVAILNISRELIIKW